MIDLTGDDDDDMAKALKLSLENGTPQRGRSPGPALQRSDRVPDPAWAMVPSNVRVYELLSSVRLPTAWSLVGRSTCRNDNRHESRRRAGPARD